MFCWCHDCGSLNSCSRQRRNREYDANDFCASGLEYGETNITIFYQFFAREFISCEITLADIMDILTWSLVFETENSGSWIYQSCIFELRDAEISKMKYLSTDSNIKTAATFAIVLSFNLVGKGNKQVTLKIYFNAVSSIVTFMRFL